MFNVHHVSRIVKAFMQGADVGNADMSLLHSCHTYMAVEDEPFMSACYKAGYKWTAVATAMAV